MDATILFLQRRTPLSRAEARIVVLDYLGWPRYKLCEHLKITVETVRTYWKRIYRKTNCRSRAELRVWLEWRLSQELGGEA